jgi:serine/threonine protein kinase
MQLTPDNWARVKEIVSNAMDLNPEERIRFAELECNGDKILLAEVLALLAADSQSFSESTRVESSGTEPAAPILKDRYIIERMLEKGGFSTTFLALDRQLFNRRVVVKVLDSFSDDPYLFHKFQEELTALSSLEHPNIIAPLDGGQLSNGTPFIVMQFAEGRTLRSILNEGLLPLGRAAQILLQLGRTVGFIHAKGIYHRDLKPENIIIQTFADGTDHLRVIDFGIASVVEQSGSTSTRVIGTLNYMAPEQLRGEVCASTDVYAFGVIAYELVTGVLPFNSNSPVSLADMQRMGVRSQPSKLRAQLTTTADTLIVQALEFQAAERPTDIARLAEDLAASLQGVGSRRPARRSLRYGLAAAVLALVSVVAAWWTRSHSPVEKPAQQLSQGNASPAAAAPVSGITTIDVVTHKPNSQFRVDGQGILQLGRNDEFRFEVSSDRPGHLYVFSRDDSGSNPLHILFPSPTTNGGRSEVRKSTPMLIPEKTWFWLGGRAGYETLVFVWSEAEKPEFEQAMRWANPHDRGRIGESEALGSVQRLFESTDNIMQSTNGVWQFKTTGSFGFARVRVFHS